MENSRESIKTLEQGAAILSKRNSTHQLSSSEEEDEAPIAVVHPLNNGPASLPNFKGSKERNANECKEQSNSTEAFPQDDNISGKDLPGASPINTVNVEPPNKRNPSRKTKSDNAPQYLEIGSSDDEAEHYDGDTDLKAILEDEYDASDVEDEGEPTVLSSGSDNEDLTIVKSIPPRTSDGEYVISSDGENCVIPKHDLKTSSSVPINIESSGDEPITRVTCKTGEISDSAECKPLEDPIDKKVKAPEDNRGIIKKVKVSRKRKNKTEEESGITNGGDEDGKKPAKKARKKKANVAATEVGETSTSNELDENQDKPKKKTRKKKKGMVEGNDAEKKPKKKRRKKTADGDVGEERDPDEEDGDGDTKKSKKSFERRNIRKIIDDDKLEAETLAAQQAEIERKQRLQEIQQRFMAEQERRRREEDERLMKAHEDQMKLIAEQEEQLRMLKEEAVKNQASELMSLLETPEDESAHPLKGQTPSPKSEKTKESEDVIELSSDEDDETDISQEKSSKLPETVVYEEDDEDEEDDMSSGSHTNDAMNIPNEDGRVLINVGHPPKDKDIFFPPQIARTIKPHQIGGVRFLYDNLVESLDRAPDAPGLGCILAHSMGLGKTIQMISFIHSFLHNTHNKTVLCIVPVNTLQNWVHEFDMWIPEKPKPRDESEKEVKKSPAPKTRENAKKRSRKAKSKANDSYKMSLSSMENMVLGAPGDSGMSQDSSNSSGAGPNQWNNRSDSNNSFPPAPPWMPGAPGSYPNAQPGYPPYPAYTTSASMTPLSSYPMYPSQWGQGQPGDFSGYPMPPSWGPPPHPGVTQTQNNYVNTQSGLDTKPGRELSPEEKEMIDMSKQMSDTKTENKPNKSLLDGEMKEIDSNNETKVDNKDEKPLISDGIKTEKIENESKEKMEIKSESNSCKVDSLNSMKQESTTPFDDFFQDPLEQLIKASDPSNIMKEEKPAEPKEEDFSIEHREFKLFLVNDTHRTIPARSKIVSEWYTQGGVLLMGYEMYRLLTSKKAYAPKRKPSKKQMSKMVIDVEEEDKNKDLALQMYDYLVKPGPDLVVCDEGHRIKNAHASISQALKNIRTKRRVVLTGYPLQNNLMEYWCMVDFVRPNFLGTKTEFSNMFERPIMNGQCVDSTDSDVRLMRFRAHVLHSLLEGFVQRRGHMILQNSLPQKTEHVLFIRMSPIQRKLYTAFMTAIQDQNLSSWTTANPIKAFSVCCKIWNHPDVIAKTVKSEQGDGMEDDLDLDDGIDGTGKKKTKGSGSKKAAARSSQGVLAEGSPSLDDPSPSAPSVVRNESIDSLSSMSSLSSSMSSMSRVSSMSSILPKTLDDNLIPPPKSKDNVITYEWAYEILKDYKEGLAENGGKMVIFLTILEETIKAGDKLLVFSQSLFTLNLIEEFLSKLDAPHTDDKWAKNKHYFRLDGSTTSVDREKLINTFNDPKSQATLFLLSTRAGCLGINLIGANRVIVMDASWNPCHDCQAVCRVYRYGQTKKCHIYRLVTENTMERRIYDRQISKQGISDRVVDELQTQTNLTRKQVDQLMEYEDKDPGCIEDDIAEKYDMDPILSLVLRKHSQWITKKPFQHESLLLDRRNQKLTKREKRVAMQGYEMEKKMNVNYTRPSYAQFYPKTPGFNHPRLPLSNNPMMSFSGRPVASVRPMISTPIPMENRKKGPVVMYPPPRGSTYVTGGMPGNSLLRPGVSVHQVQTTTDIIIPGTNTTTQSGANKIPAGEKVIVIRTPKGVYIRTGNGKIFAVRSGPKDSSKVGGVEDSNNTVPGLSLPPSATTSSSSKQNVTVVMPGMMGNRPGSKMMSHPSLVNKSPPSVMKATSASISETVSSVIATLKTKNFGLPGFDKGSFHEKTKTTGSGVTIVSSHNTSGGGVTVVKSADKPEVKAIVPSLLYDHLKSSSSESESSSSDETSKEKRKKKKKKSSARSLLKANMRALMGMTYRNKKDEKKQLDSDDSESENPVKTDKHESAKGDLDSSMEQSENISVKSKEQKSIDSPKEEKGLGPEPKADPGNLPGTSTKELSPTILYELQAKETYAAAKRTESNVSQQSTDKLDANVKEVELKSKKSAKNTKANKMESGTDGKTEKKKKNKKANASEETQKMKNKPMAAIPANVQESQHLVQPDSNPMHADQYSQMRGMYSQQSAGSMNSQPYINNTPSFGEQLSGTDTGYTSSDNLSNLQSSMSDWNNPDMSNYPVKQGNNMAGDPDKLNELVNKEAFPSYQNEFDAGHSSGYPTNQSNFNSHFSSHQNYNMNQNMHQGSEQSSNYRGSPSQFNQPISSASSFDTSTSYSQTPGSVISSTSAFQTPQLPSESNYTGSMNNQHGGINMGMPPGAPMYPGWYPNASQMWPPQSMPSMDSMNQPGGYPMHAGMYGSYAPPSMNYPQYPGYGMPGSYYPPNPMGHTGSVSSNGNSQQCSQRGTSAPSNFK